MTRSRGGNLFHLLSIRTLTAAIIVSKFTLCSARNVAITSVSTGTKIQTQAMTQTQTKTQTIMGMTVGSSETQTQTQTELSTNFIAIATLANSGVGLDLFNADLDTVETFEFPSLRSEVTNGGFDDLAIDPVSNLVFALSFRSRRVCSFTLETDQSDAGKISLNPVGSCTSTTFNTNPFSGVSCYGGVLTISGGTGGVTIFTYDTRSGEIDDSPVILNQRLGDTGHPDVTMVTDEIIALSTDFNLQNFGVAVASFDGISLTRRRQYEVSGSIGFNLPQLFQQPTNFPLVSSVYDQRDGGTYLYVANGAITVQDPTRNDTPTVVSDSSAVPRGFTALAVDINSEANVALFGGSIGQDEVLLLLDISNPLRPEFLGVDEIGDANDGLGRITSVATAGTNILYVRRFDEDISHSWTLTNAMLEEVPVGEEQMTTNTEESEESRGKSLKASFQNQSMLIIVSLLFLSV